MCASYDGAVFTGLIREVATVASMDGGAGGVRLTVAAPETSRDAIVGDSVAISGVCLTVVAVEDELLSFDAVPETLQRSSLGRLGPGDRVNVEPALRAGEPLGGHYVQGHVDGVGAVRSVEPEGDGKRIWFDAPADLLRYVVEKGSVSVEGTSLTVAGLDGSGFAVALIPHTLEATTLGGLNPGDSVNLEADVLAKYVEKLLAR
jgi:riboflavin synthase